MGGALDEGILQTISRRDQAGIRMCAASQESEQAPPPPETGTTTEIIAFLSQDLLAENAVQETAPFQNWWATSGGQERLSHGVLNWLSRCKLLRGHYELIETTPEQEVMHITRFPNGWSHPEMLQAILQINESGSICMACQIGEIADHSLLVTLISDPGAPGAAAHRLWQKLPAGQINQRLASLIYQLIHRRMDEVKLLIQHLPVFDNLRSRDREASLIEGEIVRIERLLDELADRYTEDQRSRQRLSYFQRMLDRSIEDIETQSPREEQWMPEAEGARGRFLILPGGPTSIRSFLTRGATGELASSLDSGRILSGLYTEGIMVPYAGYVPKPRELSSQELRQIQSRICQPPKTMMDTGINITASAPLVNTSPKPAMETSWNQPLQ